MTDSALTIYPAVTDQAPQVPASPIVTELVGEGKQYRTITDLEQGKVKADEHISTLEAKLDELKAELVKRDNKDMITEGVQAALQQQQGNQQPAETPAVESTVPTVDDLAKLVQAAVDNNSAKAATQSNLDKVNEYLRSTFGEGQETEATTKAATALGMDYGELVQLAAKAPEAFKKLVGESKISSASPTPSEVNPQALASNTPAVPEKTDRKMRMSERYQGDVMAKAHAEARKQAGIL